jgi:curli biogenesis system outer membrane secretion channel CsgG
LNGGQLSGIAMRRATVTWPAAWLLTLALTTTGGSAALAQSQPGGRPTVSVPEFKNSVSQSWWWSGPVADDLSAALANELQASGSVQVVERRNLKEVLSEQELAELGIVRQDPAAAQRGQMTGARYIVLGTVSSYESNVESKTSGGGMSLLGIGGRREQAETTDYVAIDIRVVDSTTGEVVGFRTVEGSATSTAESRQQGVNLLPAAGLTILGVPMSRGGQALVGAAGTFRYDSSTSETQRTPVGKALRAALVDASDYVSCLLAPQGDCMERFEAQEQRRRQRTRGVLQLD